MAHQSLEEKLETLLKRVDSIEHENERLRAKNAIQNIIGKMAYLFEVGMHEERMKYIAKKTPGVTIEWGARGVFEGYEGARRTMVDMEMNFERMHAAGMKIAYPGVEFKHPRAGMIETSLIGTTVIEVAADCKTAKAVWTSLMIAGKSGEDGRKPGGVAIWWKAGADFVVEDGEWKIWHFEQNPLFAGPQDKNWIELCLNMPSPPPPGSPWKNPHKGDQAWPVPDKPCTKIYHPYRFDSVPELYPVPPEPYETFEEKE